MKAENIENIKNNTQIKDNINLEVKIPKKRGRKPKNKNLLVENSNIDASDIKNNDKKELTEKPKKKRGRKPKNTTGIVEVKIPKKRGRKPNIMNSSSTNKIINNTNQMKDNILHLKVSSEDINESMITDSIYKYNPDINTPLPYEPLNNSSEPAFLKLDNNENIENNEPKKKFNETNINNLFNNNPIEENNNINSNLDFENNNNVQNEVQPIEPTPIEENISHQIEMEQNRKKKNIKPIMFYYNEFNKRKEWPKFSNIKCLWCCHNFDCPPCAIPIKLKHGTFYVYGNFCSKECAASYNFDSNEDKSIIWERYTLLNYLYSIIEDEPNLTIKMAPSRLTLESFGGYLDIKEFRNTGSVKEYNIIYPPMVSIIPSVEEKYKDKLKRKENYYIPLDKERIKKANNDLRLKRKKPISNKNTLENCMRLKYN